MKDNYQILIKDTSDEGTISVLFFLVMMHIFIHFRMTGFYGINIQAKNSENKWAITYMQIPKKNLKKTSKWDYSIRGIVYFKYKYTPNDQIY